MFALGKIKINKIKRKYKTKQCVYYTIRFQFTKLYQSFTILEFFSYFPSQLSEPNFLPFSKTPPIYNVFTTPKRSSNHAWKLIPDWFSSQFGYRRLALDDRRSALGGQRSALGGQRSALGDQRSAVGTITSSTWFNDTLVSKLNSWVCYSPSTLPCYSIYIVRFVSQ